MEGSLIRWRSLGILIYLTCSTRYNFTKLLYFSNIGQCFQTQKRKIIENQTFGYIKIKYKIVFLVALLPGIYIFEKSSVFECEFLL